MDVLAFKPDELINTYQKHFIQIIFNESYEFMLEISTWK